MLINSLDNLYLSLFGTHEEFESEIVKKIIKKGNIVIDIGAHMGYYTLLFARTVGENGHVYSFEPDPRNFDLLKKNVEINGYKNVTLIQKAVSNKTGRGKLYLGEYSGGNRIFDTHDDRKSIEIETIRLDDYFENNSRKIDFLKMDAEGTEIDIIEGMNLLLQKSQNIRIMCEFYPTLIKKFGREPEEYLKSLNNQGFKLFHLNADKKIMEPVNNEKLMKEYNFNNEKYTNLFCTKDDGLNIIQ